MTELERIRDQFQRAWDGDAWHGTPLWTLLGDVTTSEANARPIVGGHTIAEIVMHLAYWQKATQERLAGQRVTPGHDEQWPPPCDNSDTTWREALALLETNRRALMQAVAKMSEGQLTNPVEGRDYDVYVQLHGTIQHDIFHTGQIALLKRAVRA